MRHAIAVLFVCTFGQAFGLSREHAAKLGYVASIGVEIAQRETRRGHAELKDVRDGVIGVGAFLAGSHPSFSKPDAATVVDTELRRLNRALLAECDSVRRGRKTFTDSAAREYAKACR